MKNMEWYNTLNKPLFTPPVEVFKPAWIILYLLMAISLILYVRDGINKGKILGLVCFFVQLAFNFVWGNIFFGMKNISSALVVAVLMLIFTFFTAIYFYKYSKLSAILLVPYFLWICFAIYLNIGFLILN